MISDSLHEVASCMMKKHGDHTGSNAFYVLHRAHTMPTCLSQLHRSSLYAEFFSLSTHTKQKNGV